MIRATAAFVNEELGELDDLGVAEVVAMGASEAEVVEARAWLDGAEELTRELPGPSTGIVERILALAQRAQEAETEGPDLV